MIRSFLTLFVCVALLLPTGFARGSLWHCEMDGRVHVDRCCDDMRGDDASAGNDCCAQATAGAERAVPPALTAPPAVFLPTLHTTWTTVAKRARHRATPRARAVAPPATGPPIWLQVRSLLR